jgi:hypothetical protein
MNVTLHEAEHCQNELSRCKGSWYSKDRFDIILKWMKLYHERMIKNNETPISKE